jgi:hypothetical protein
MPTMASPATARTKSVREHWPSLETLLMIERVIKDSEMPPRRTELWNSLPRKTIYQTFKKALEYLEASDKIMIDKEDRVVWTAVDSPKLRKLIDEAVRVR